MAISATKSATAKSAANATFTLKVTFTEQSTSTANNTSKIKVTGKLLAPDVGSWSAIQSSYVRIYWHDNNTNKDTLVGASTAITEFGNKYNIPNVEVVGEIDATHKGDGTLSGYAIAKFVAGTTLTYMPPSFEVSTANTALTSIPRQSSFGTITGSTIGSGITVNITRNSSSFTHSLWYSFGSLTWQGIASGVGTSYTFTPPLSICSQIPSATSGTMTLILRTYNGSTQIGSDVYKDITVSVPSSVVPTMNNPTHTLIDETADKLGVYCQGYCKTKISITGASGSYGSWITAYKITGAGTSSSSSELTTGTLNASGNYTFTCTITDSRGRTCSKQVTVYVYPYSTPTLSIVVKRCTSSGAISSSGTYVSVTPTYSFASVNGKNGLKSGPTATGNNNSKTGGASGTSFILGSTNYPFAVNSTYQIKVTLTDKVGKTTTAYANIPTDVRIINIKKNGKGIGFGGFASKDNAIQCFWDLYVGENKVSVEGHAHSNYATSNHTHSYLPLSGGTITGTLTIQDAHLSMGGGNIYTSNNTHYLGAIGLRGDWVGLYPSYSDCLNETNRKGWYGHNGGTSLSYVNEAGGYIQLNTNGDGIGFTCSYGMLYFDGSWRPQGSNSGAFNLGESYSKWKQLYATTATIATSDRNEKKDFTEFDERYEKLFFDLKPQLFKFKNGESNRFHSGFISQDVEESLIKNDLTALDFAGFCKDKKQIGKVNEEGIEEFTNVLDEEGNQVYDYSLRYEEFIAMNTHMIQKCWNRINELENRMRV